MISTKKETHDILYVNWRFLKIVEYVMRFWGYHGYCVHLLMNENFPIIFFAMKNSHFISPTKLFLSFLIKCSRLLLNTLLFSSSSVSCFGESIKNCNKKSFFHDQQLHEKKVKEIIIKIDWAPFTHTSCGSFHFAPSPRLHHHHCRRCRCWVEEIKIWDEERVRNYRKFPFNFFFIM